MRSIYISLSASPGMQRYAKNICNEMSLSNDEVILICTKNYDIVDIYQGIKIYNGVSTKTPRLELSTFNIIEIIRVIKYIKSMNPDVIHFLADHPWNPMITWALKKYTIVHTIHDPIPHPGELVTIFKRINNYMIMNILKQDVILHGTKYFNQLIAKKVSKENIHIVPLATEKCTNEAIKLTDEKKVLFFGRIKPYKGLDLFIKSIEKSLSNDKDIIAVIAGDGDLGQYHELIKNKQNYIIKNYEIPENDIEELFKEAKVVVLPYQSATQSGIVPISYYYGKPVIVTNVGSLPEVVDDGKTGYVVNKNVREISEKILDLVNNNEKCLKFGKQAQEKLNTELSISNMTDGFRDVYNYLKTKRI